MKDGAPEPIPIPVPMIIEDTGLGERSYDIYSRLLKDRIIFIRSEIDDNLANLIVAQMLFLQTQDGQAGISLYINSPGGSVTAGMAIYDTMQFLTCDVATYCVGMAASMGSFLLAAGTKGKRYALPNSDIMLHQPSGVTEGMASDVQRSMEQLLRTKKRINRLLAFHTGKSETEIMRDIDRDYWLSAEEARDYGIIDEVVASAPGSPGRAHAS
jgi:ATP-dependent Clp protease, protease subunit